MPQNIVHKPYLESAEEVSSLTKYGEIEEAEQSSNITAVHYINQTNFNANSRGRLNIGARGTNQARERGRRPFVRQIKPEKKWPL